MAEPARAGVKTLAIRLDDELHAQLVVLAQLDGLTLTEAIRQAIERYVEAKRAEGDLAGKAQDVLAEIDREAASRKSAIEALFGPPTEQAPAKSRAGRKKGPAEGTQA